ncbi:hypothetical protein BC629DRAFT_249560 [Irpex lacteus]|nr:hypothetical protein BC629DRAFT_249560 [Irpex lacteus]
MFSPTGRFVAACIALASAVCATTLPRLVPSRRTGQLVSRGLDLLVPKQEAILSYSTAPHHPPAANVAFIAHPSIPILLLEDIEFVLEEIVCSSPQQNGRNLAVRFAVEDAFQAALDSWSTLDEFIVLTAHHGCNSYGDRGSWRTVAVVADAPSLTITLTVEPISMREVGRSFSVRYDHTGGSHDLLSRDEMAKRDIHSFDRVFTYAYNPTIDERLQLFPFQNLQVAESLLQQLDDANLNLTCVGCSLNTNVSLGLHFDVDIGDASCTVTNQSCFTLNQAAMNLTVQNMNLTAALEVALGKELSAAANYSIIRVPVAPALSIPNLIQLSPAIGLGVEFSLDVAAGINFTYGASGSISSGAFASVSLIDSSGQFNPTVRADGWDGSGVDQIPFRVNDGQFTVTTGLSFAPFAEVPFTILDTGAVLRIN